MNFSNRPALALGLVLVIVPLANAQPSPAQERPVPFIGSVSPLTIAPGSPGFTLVVNGAHFSPDSLVRWNGTDIVPASATASRIECQIAAWQVATAGTAVVMVVSGPPGGGVSNQALVHLSTPATALAFASSTNSTGAQPAAVAAIDLNADGPPDIIAVNTAASSVSVLLGHGDGSFGANADVATGDGPVALHVADVNRDGRFDLLTANAASGTVSVLLGNGDGTFRPAAETAVGSGASALAAGDLNTDSFLDLAVVNTGANSVSVLLGNGDGTFTPHADYATAADPHGVIVGDFNDDGRLDVMTADRGAASLSLLPGVGDGTLGPRMAIAAGNGPRDLAAGDFNGDGMLDVAVVNEFQGTVSIILGNGAGTFLAGRDTAVGGIPQAIALGDVNADGRLDAVVPVREPDTISVLLGDGSGMFAPSLNFPAVSTPRSVAGADFDQDGRLDVVVTNPHADTVSVLTATIRANLPPVVVNPGVVNAFRGIAVTHGLSAEDADGDALTWSAEGLPPGITLNPIAGVLSGIPTAMGTFSTTIAASDGRDTASATFMLNVASPIPGAATPLGPSGALATATPSLSWSAVALVGYYALSVTDANAAASTGLAWFTPAQAGCAGGSGTCTVTTPRALTPGPVSWKVLTWNSFGYGPWSQAATFVVDLPDLTVPTPTPGGPSGRATRMPTYTWTAIDGVSWYQLSITDALGVVRESWYSSTVCAATVCAATPSAQVPAGQARWRIRAWRATGAGAWSAYVSFDAADALPGQVSLVGPSRSVATSTPTFTWNAVSMASYYLMAVTDRENARTERWYRPGDAACAAGSGICTVTPGLQVKAGMASWKVLTWNATGYGPWSETGNFLVEIPDPAAAVPVAMSPTGTTMSASVTYQWTAVAGALTYRLSILTSAGTRTSFWYTPATAGCDTSAVCHIPALTVTNGTLEWQVQAWTARGYGPWTTPVTLTVQIPPRPARQVSAVRLIEYGWDAPTPDFVRTHVRDMERRPFDGVVMHLPDDGGQVFQPWAWNAERLASQLSILGDIEWQSFDSCFLATYATSSMNWFDDGDWNIVLQHAAFMARAALAGRCKGLIFDPEPYGASPWNYAEQPGASAHTFREYQVLVRERGRAFMRALQQEYPGLDVLTFAGYSYFLHANSAPDADARDRMLKDHAWGLLPAFLDGMLEVADSNAHIIDGQEQSYYSERPEDFEKGDTDIRERAFPYVAPELADQYIRHVETGQPLYLDWLFGYFTTSRPSLGDGLEAAQRARLAEHHAYYAMKNVDQYVWVYSEKMNWWTGENLPAGAEGALASAKRKFLTGEDLGFDLSSMPQEAP